jgi:hypothetical protein
MEPQTQAQAEPREMQKPAVIQPSQVWQQLTPLQQQQTGQRIIQVCRLLTQPRPTTEVQHEQ